MKKIIILLLVAVVLFGGVYASRHVRVISTEDEDAVATTTQTSVIPTDGTVTLKLGETAAFRGFIIRPELVTEDSRCPAGVYCIQAGSLSVKFGIDSDSGSSVKTVKLGESFLATDTEKVTFVSSDPLKTTKPLTAADYSFTITVEKQ